ncbi:Glycosyltransferase [Elusimicrobium minutum Pei191]|uniref:Glycosyltransferase n=1 Tax=Elusimicrobium minutum (strain Pei191) TaxID=445932 RepID=B2KF00_ELUMP|nr:glycosyltransferase [Elusimicrobium minutum]ACC99096.1 Glycosyltransferase [Elusimicrobium minutum Pei191]
MKIDNYSHLVSPGEIEYIKKTGMTLKGKTANIVTTAAYGSGVSELVGNVLPFFQDFDIETKRINLNMPKDFLDISKKFYEGLSNSLVNITQEDLDFFLSFKPLIREQTSNPCDLLYANDHAALTAIDNKVFKKAIWRCHIDVSHSNPFLWHFLKRYIEKFDVSAFSFPSFSGNLSIPKFSIMPAIDPLSDKNKEIPEEYINSVFEKYNIPRSKPILLQIGRYDVLKDPLGVIEVYQEVAKEYNCILVLAGGEASDDPASHSVYKQVLEKAQEVPGVHVLLLDQNDLEINALQRGSTIVIQKSIRESFGLAITEALWKKKPVVASETGGIPLQIIEGLTGLFSVSNVTCVQQIKRLLKNPKLGEDLGLGGYEHVKENFLITRHVRDLMLMFSRVLETEV